MTPGVSILQKESSDEILRAHTSKYQMCTIWYSLLRFKGLHDLKELVVDLRLIAKLLLDLQKR
jgi:hypothetical protein